MDKIRKLYNKSGCDGIIILSELSCYYFSGFYADFSYIVAGKDFINFYTDKRYFDEAKMKVNCNIKLITADNALDIIKEDIKDFKKIGIDESKVYYSEYMKLKSILNSDIVNIGNYVEEIRAFKNDDELILSEKAVAIADEVYSEVLGLIKEGMTERELAFLIDSKMIEKGAQSPAFDTIVAFSENAAYPHWVRSDRKLKNGNIILMDYGARYRGYNSDMTRTISFGKASEEFKKVYNIVKDANIKAEEEIYDGISAKDADGISREYIKEHGYGDYFTHSLGHGVGFEIHEFPRVGPSSEAVLKRDMLFTVEPGIYLNGKFGVRVEDLVKLDDKVSVLTKSNKNLTEL